MRLDFIDENRLLAQARGLTATGMGRLQLWHQERYKPHAGVAFEDRTPGDILAEFYMTVASEVDRLAPRRADLESAELERLLNLEDVLKPVVEERVSLRGLSPEGSAAVVGAAHTTGDPLADYWEYRLARGHDVDFGLIEAPPRAEWDRVD